MADRGRRPIGRVAATESRPSTASAFCFWAEERANVGIGSIVMVEAPRPIDDQSETSVRVYGMVTEAEGFTDLASPMHDYLGQEGDPGLEAATERPHLRLFTAAVLRVIPEYPLQAVPVAPVQLASPDEVAEALQMRDYVERGRGIPIGLYRAGGAEHPVFLDRDFLLGPESAHLSVSGVSGLATKTSAIEFLLRAIFDHHEENAEAGSVAAICFNVKGPDLLYLDVGLGPPEDPALADAYRRAEGRELAEAYRVRGVRELDEEERATYRSLGVSPRPFERVRYYAPLFPNSEARANSLRSHPALDAVNPVTPLTWGLGEVFEFSEVLLNRDDVDAKADAVLSFIRDRVLDRRFKVEARGRELAEGQVHEVRTFDELRSWFDDVLRCCEEANAGEWQTHNVATLRKVKNRLDNIAQRTRGLVTRSSQVSDLPFAGGFEPQTAYVIDVANQDPQVQDLVFARVVAKVRDRLERGGLGVDRVVVFVDELNKYAPSDGPDTYLRSTLLDISERGRYLGLVLFGAQQFRSQVHKRVVGNSGTALFGRMDLDELAQPGYAVMSTATKQKLATLTKGDLLVRHPHFAHPVFVRFPRPPVLTGSDGRALFRPQDLDHAEALERAIRSRHPDIGVRELRSWLAEVGVDRADRAWAAALAEPGLEKPLAFLRRVTGRPEDASAGANTARNRLRGQPSVSREEPLRPLRRRDS